MYFQSSVIAFENELNGSFSINFISCVWTMDMIKSNFYFERKYVNKRQKRIRYTAVVKLLSQ